MNPDRLNSFTDAYAPALLKSLESLGRLPLAPGESVEDYALSTAIAMMERLQLYGLDSIAHYWLNRAAFKDACATLGIEPTARSIENYLEGR